MRSHVQSRVLIKYTLRVATVLAFVISGIRGFVVISAEFETGPLMEGEKQIAEAVCDLAEELARRKLLPHGHGDSLQPKQVRDVWKDSTNYHPFFIDGTGACTPNPDWQ